VLLTRPDSVYLNPEPNLVPPKEAPTNDDPSSNPVNHFHHFVPSTQQVAFSQANHSLPPDYRYSAITTGTCTGDPTNSYFVDPALLPPGRTEEAATFDRADCDMSNPTPPHTFQSNSSTAGTFKYVGGGSVPIATAIPQASTPARIDRMGSNLQPDPLANLRPLIVTEYAFQIRQCSNLCSPFTRPTFHVELMMYQNRPVVPATVSGLSVVQQRREVAVWLTLDISSIPTHNAKPWSAIRISRTPSVNTHREDPAGANILYIDVVVSGATNHKAYPEACRNCKERRGAGPMIDFRGKSDIIKVTTGIARAHFVFCCYPADRDEEKYYRCVRCSVLVPILLLTSLEQCRSCLIRKAQRRSTARHCSKAASVLFRYLLSSYDGENQRPRVDRYFIGVGWMCLIARLRMVLYSIWLFPISPCGAWHVILYL
jgi:hypothetical protein